MILKAGTYRFNDVLTIIDGLSITIDEPQIVSYPLELHINFDGVYTFTTIDFTVDAYQGRYTYDVFYESESVYTNDNGNIEWYGDFYKVVTLATDQTVEDIFGSWFISNTNYNEVNAKPLAEITYNGETIAQLNAGETCTLKCGSTDEVEYKMATDVVVKIESGYIKPSGTLTITEDGSYDVKNYESVEVKTVDEDSIGGVWEFNKTITPPNNISELYLLFVCEGDDGSGFAYTKLTFNYEDGAFKSITLSSYDGGKHTRYTIEEGWCMNTTIYVTPSFEYDDNTLNTLKSIATKIA